MKQELVTLFQDLTAFNNSLEYEVVLPVKNNHLKFKQITTKQFNEILGTLADGVVSNDSMFDVYMCDILNNNLLQENTDIRQLNLIDYNKVVLETRRQCISDSLNILFSQEDIENYDLNENYTTISLAEHLKQELQVPQTPIEVSNENITVKVNIPTIEKVIKLNKELRSDKQDTTPEIIKFYFIKEIAKFIDTITINNISVEFRDTDTNDFIEFVNNLPALLINEVIFNIEKIKQTLTALSTVTISCKQANGEMINVNKEIYINGNLFNF